MRHRRPLLGGLAGVASALCGAYLILNWPIIEVALFGPVLLWRLVAPRQVRSHPRRNAYILSFSLLILGFLVLILDQPQDADPSASVPRIAVSVIDDEYLNEQLKGIRFSEPPTITLQAITTAPGTWRWFGILEFTLTAEPQKQRKDRDIWVYALLPNISRPEPWGNVEPDQLKLTDLSEDQDLLRVAVRVTKSTSVRRVILSFEPHIPLQPVRLGEKRIVLSRGPFLVGNPVPDRLLPRLQVKVSLSTTDMVAQPAPSYSIRNIATWQLGEPITESNIPTVNLNPATSMEDIDVTLTDRRIRLLADLSVELLLLASGLLLGLIVEPAIDPSGIRQRQARTTLESENQARAAPARLTKPLRGIIRLLVLIEAIRSIFRGLRHRRN
jgi:hypothetical protein